MPSVPPLRLGVLGTGAIARSFARVVGGAPDAAGRVVAVASRAQQSADAFAGEFGLARAHAGYAALLADPAVDAVYNALPNGLHAEWTVRAAEAGKHVLCEKPLGPSAAEAARMFAAADRAGVAVLEAFPYVYHPQMDATLALVAAGTDGAGGGGIGPVRLVQAAFGFTLADPANPRWDPALGGGALLDVGCYPVSFARRVVGERPARAHAVARWAPGGGAARVDVTLAGTLEYPGGAVAHVAGSFETALHRRATVVGAGGVLETDFPNHTRPTPDAQLRVRRGPGGGPFADVAFGAGNGFLGELAAFAAMARAPGGAAERAARACSLDDAAALDALLASARAGRTVELAAG